MKAQATGLKRIVVAFQYSWEGLKAAVATEAALRQELYLTVPLMILSYWLPITIYERMLLIGSLWLILLMELVNTAIESIIDLVSPEYHVLAKKAKDIGSLLVLMSFIYAIYVWYGILRQCWWN